MKRLFTLLAALQFVYSGFSQIPEKMSYQAVVRNDKGELVKESPVGIQISILSNSINGTPVFVETHSTATNNNGLITVEIGEGTLVTGTLADIDWSTDTYFLKTETDPSGGTNYTIAGTSQLLSVPYALYAKSSGSSNDAVKLTGDQTISGNKTFSGTTTVAAPVNDTDAANKAYVDELKNYLNQLKGQIEELQNTEGLDVKDIDGNTYKTVSLGTQVWMAENLKTTKYNDGTDIPNVTDPSAWANLTSPGYSWYNNDIINKDVYGAYYNWYAIDIRNNGGKNVCPVGWHVATDEEWRTLITYLTDNGYGYEGSGDDIAKSIASTTNWTVDPTPGNVGNDQESNNSTGFNAIPAGRRSGGDGSIWGLSIVANWWTGTPYNENANIWSILNDSSILQGTVHLATSGESVRCIKD